jgi:hypothetical protein
VATDWLLPVESRSAIVAYLDAQRRLSAALRPLSDYLRFRDYEDDAYAAGPRLWADASDELADYLDAWRSARTLAIPAARAAIAEAVAAHERAIGGRDPTGWRVAIGLAQRDLAAAAARLIEPRGDVAADLPAPDAMLEAVRPAYDALIEVVASAPASLREPLRNLAAERDHLPQDRDQASALYALIDPYGDQLTATADGPLLLDAY